MIILIIGFIGMLLVLTAFVLEEFTRHTTRESRLYNLLNLFGAILLAIYALFLKSYPFLILNILWASFALLKIVRNLQR